MTAGTGPGSPGATHIWVPFRDTSLYVQFADGTRDVGGMPDVGGTRGADPQPDHRGLLADAVPPAGVTPDDRYGDILWRVDAEHLHAVVEALWSADRPLRIHLDQAPRRGDTDERDG